MMMPWRSLLYLLEIKCGAVVEIVVKSSNQLVFGFIGVGLGARPTHRVHTTRLRARSSLYLGLGVAVRGRLMHGASLPANARP